MTSPLQPKKIMFLYDSVYYYDKKSRRLKINRELDNTYFVESELIVERLKRITKDYFGGDEDTGIQLNKLIAEIERTK